MINLIPQRAKRRLVLEYWVRVGTVWLVLCSFALLMGAVVLLPTYVLIGSQVKVYEQSAMTALQKVETYEVVSTALVQANREAKIIIDEATKPKLSQFVERIKGLQGEGIQMRGVRVVRTEEGITPITLQGHAQDRQGLAAFRDRLQADPLVKTVELPISNLAQDKDISFTMNIIVVTNQTDI